MWCVFKISSLVIWTTQVHSDHKLLEMIVKKAFNWTPARPQRMLLRLQKYQFKFVYQKGTSLNIADTFARAPLDNPSTSNVNSFEVFGLETETEYPEHHYQLKNDTEMKILATTKNDNTLQRLYTTIQQGWPEKYQLLDHDLKPFWNFCDELTINNGIIYNRQCTLIPEAIKHDMLENIHANHMIAASNTRMEKRSIFFATFVKGHCRHVQLLLRISKISKNSTKTANEIVTSTVTPLADYKSGSLWIWEKWLSCHRMSFFWLDWGWPLSQTEFISDEFKMFSRTYGFQHTRSAPYYPKENEQAEAAVKVAKNMLKWSDDFYSALLN